MKDFAAIDFETANEQRTSVCSVGVVVVRGGEIIARPYTGGYCGGAGISICVGEGGSADRRAAVSGPQQSFR